MGYKTLLTYMNAFEVVISILRFTKPILCFSYNNKSEREHTHTLTHWICLYIFFIVDIFILINSRLSDNGLVQNTGAYLICLGHLSILLIPFFQLMEQIWRNIATTTMRTTTWTNSLPPKMPLYVAHFYMCMSSECRWWAGG